MNKSETERKYKTNGYEQHTGQDGIDWDYSFNPTISSTLISSSKSWSNLPGYKRIIAAGRNATTNFIGDLQTLEQYGSFSGKQYANTTANPAYVPGIRKQAIVWDGNIAVPALPPSGLSLKALNQAQTAFYKQYEHALSLVSGGTILGELRETLHLIRNPLRALRGGIGNYLSALKKRRKGSRPAKKKLLADTWLEYSFGWLPLLHDIDDAVNYLHRREAQLRREFIHLYGHGEAHDTVISAQSYYPGGSAQLNCYKNTTQHATQRYGGAVAAEVLGNKMSTLSSLGLSPRSFVPTLWELLPWSFVFDYFTNIGDVISAYSNGVARLAWGYETTRKESKQYLSGGSISPRGGIVTVMSKSVTIGAGTSSRKSVSRTSVTYVPLPSVAFELPGYGTKWLNLAALASSRRSLTPF